MSNYLRIYKVLSEKPLKNEDGEYYIKLWCTTPSDPEEHEERMHFDDYDSAVEILDHLKDIKGYVESCKIDLMNTIEAASTALDTANKMAEDEKYFVDFPVGSPDEDDSDDEPASQSKRIH